MFSNLKVVDLSTVLAGPSVATFFAELGAKVIKIENPNNLDVTRSWKLPIEDETASVSSYFSSVNFKKEYVKLDLKDPEHNVDFRNLIQQADILITNFKKGDEEKFGLSDAVLRESNPRLIIGKINGFGSDSDRVAYDLILQAETGFMSINGTPGSGPVKLPVALIDVMAAHHLKEGLLLAIIRRMEDNLGRTVTVSLYDAAVCSLMNQASNYLMTGQVPARIGSLHPNIAPYGELFTTQDNAYITFAIGSDVQFRKLCSILKLNSIVEDLRFFTNYDRVKNRAVLFEILQNEITKWTADSLLNQFILLQVPAGKVKKIDEVFEDKQAFSLIREEVIDKKLTKRITSIAFKWES
jgi:crotonobetainyl-CoA:carnitine CoA-transferase CaiB-like acyl-CoA transferase